MRVGIAIVALALGACVQADVTVCDGVLCPGDNVCGPNGGCITPDRVCFGEDGSACAYEGVPDGACDDGVCIPAACGNGVREPDEACDDGNLDPFDDCASDCQSTNACGNGVLDAFRGEQCDEGDFLDHDGCSSTCRLEQPRWRQVAIAPYQRRGYPAATYDASRGRVVMFGGSGILGGLGDTWEWDGDGWTVHNVAPRPPSRFGAGLAYDARHQVSVLFGGGNFDDTWAWDGAAWTQQAVALTPGARAYHAMAYDAARAEVVMFGGLTPTGEPLGDTWVWDGAAWTMRPVVGPPARINATMGYDASRDRIVLYGGAVFDGPVLGDTWEWDGAAWTLASPDDSPPAMTGATMTYDPVRARIQMFGGMFGAAPIDELWEYDGATWTLGGGAGGPPRREGAGFVYDLARGGPVVFSGVDSTGIIATRYDDTWTWDGAAWQERLPFARPAPDPAGASLVYDPLHARSVLSTGAEIWTWGGTAWTPAPSPGVRGEVAFDAYQRLVVLFDGETAMRTWDGAAWSTTAAAPPPPARRGHALSCAGFDSVLLFGGRAIASGGLSDTWAWDGTWTDVSSVGGPSKRERAGLACDPRFGRAILFGGLDDQSGQSLRDTWEFVGGSWMQIETSLSPEDSAGHRLVDDPFQQETLMFGGSAEGVWAWDSLAWEFLATPVAPEPRQDAGLAFDAARGQLVLFGGITAGGAVDETWVFEWTAGGVPEACRHGVDTDGDGAIGCDDPDCWPLCTPLCPPGAECVAERPRCGDATCDPLEDCRLCPEDCGACEPVCGDFLCDPGETCAGDC